MVARRIPQQPLQYHDPNQIGTAGRPGRAAVGSGAVRDRSNGKMLLRCHMHQTVNSPHGETYTVSIDRRGMWFALGRLAWLTLPVGWLLHTTRWPDQWWLRAARPPHGREYRQWRLTNLWWYGPYTGQTKARQEMEQLISNIGSGRWHDGQLKPESPT